MHLIPLASLPLVTIQIDDQPREVRKLLSTKRPDGTTEVVLLDGEDLILADWWEVKS